MRAEKTSTTKNRLNAGLRAATNAHEKSTGGASRRLLASGVGKNDRFFVPDVSPLDRQELEGLQPRFIFVAESPHLNEVQPESLADRRPLCGAAGRVWWKKLGEILEGRTDEDVSLTRMERLCRKHRCVVMNAVQYPLDPKIAARYPDAEPVKNLGFAKVAGEWGYKKRKKSAAVQKAVEDLRARLTDSCMDQAMIWPLGNDAEWFVAQALGPEEAERRVAGKIPHPSAWWRRGGLFDRIAQEKLEDIFGGAGRKVS